MHLQPPLCSGLKGWYVSAVQPPATHSSEGQAAPCPPALGLLRAALTCGKCVARGLLPGLLAMSTPSACVSSWHRSLAAGAQELSSSCSCRRCCCSCREGKGPLAASQDLHLPVGEAADQDFLGGLFGNPGLSSGERQQGINVNRELQRTGDLCEQIRHVVQLLCQGGGGCCQLCNAILALTQSLGLQAQQTSCEE